LDEEQCLRTALFVYSKACLADTFVHEVFSNDIHVVQLTFLLQLKKVSKKSRSLLNFLIAKNGLFLRRSECIPSSSTQMTSLSFAPRISHFLLKL
jgi:hypothetical protein